MLAALAVAFVRSPLLLLHGRIYAEEGSVYLQRGWDAPPLQALLALHQGYYSLLMDGLAVFTARLIEPEHWALAMTTASLAMLMLAVFLAITCEQFETTRARMMAAGVVLLTPSIEVWMTAEDMQFYLVVCTALICISSEHRHRVLRGLTLLLAALTGPASCAIAPFFLWRAWRRRTAGAYFQAAIITVCALAQGLVLLGSLRSGSRTLAGYGKFAWFGPVLFLKIFSVDFFTRLGEFQCRRIVQHRQDVAVCLLLWLLSLLSLGLFRKMAKLGGEAAQMCFWMALASLAFDYTGIAEPMSVVFAGAARYFFAGFVLLSMTLVLAYAKAQRTGTVREQKLALALVLLVLFCGAVDAAGYWTRLQIRTPDWSAEVARWRKDPSTPLRTSPLTWDRTIHLHPHQH
jgi:uncharacterized membrane protein